MVAAYGGGEPFDQSHLGHGGNGAPTGRGKSLLSDDPLFGRAIGVGTTNRPGVDFGRSWFNGSFRNRY